VDKPVEPKPVEAPPPGPLALDAKGGAGTDSFGLGGKQGGSDFLNGGGGTRGGHYAVMIISEVERRLHEDQKLDTAKFRGTVKIWFSPAGKVERVEILHSTGDSDIDARIREAIATMPGLPEAFPQDLGPAIVRVGARASNEG
jgi:TonB family protein